MSDEKTEFSPTGFSAPDCEVSDDELACAACGDEKPASEMMVSIDNITRRDGAVVSVERRYVCSEDCAVALMFGLTEVGEC